LEDVIIGFLLGELIKQQMLDDRIAQINGIFVQSQRR
jgi:uncharacterized membrane protein YcaP (DUF421 family)